MEKIYISTSGGFTDDYRRRAIISAKNIDALQKLKNVSVINHKIFERANKSLKEQK